MRCATTHHHQLASAVSVSAGHFDEHRSDGEADFRITEQHQQIALSADAGRVRENSGETSGRLH
jgi:hypothetical protein